MRRSGRDLKTETTPNTYEHGAATVASLRSTAARRDGVTSSRHVTGTYGACRRLHNRSVTDDDDDDDDDVVVVLERCETKRTTFTGAVRQSRRRVACTAAATGDRMSACFSARGSRLIASPPRPSFSRGGGCDVLRYAWLACLKKLASKRHEIFCTCYMWPSHGPAALATMLYTSGFVDDVVFSHNRAHVIRIQGRIFISSAPPLPPAD